MYPSQMPLGYVQPHNGPFQPNVVTMPTAPVQYPVPQHNGQFLTNIQTRLKLSATTVNIVPSVVACIAVLAVAEFFFITTFLTLVGAVQNAKDFSDDPSHDGNVLYIVFYVFFSVASAMCAPMVLNSGYSIIVMSGTVLMLFSTLSSSVVTSAEILVIPYSVFGACAYGLLRTGPQIAMLDFLNDRRGLATGLSYLGVTIGQLAAAMSFGFTDMKDDANYDDDGPPRWPNNMRVIEVTAVLSLMAAAIIRKPSFTTGSWPELFQYVPFYVLCFINFCVSLVSAILVALLGAASYINKLIYEEFWEFAVYGGGAGFVRALVRVCLPLTLITFVGRLNYKIGLPFLELTGGLGALSSYIIKNEVEIPDEEPIETGWYIAAAMFTVYAVLALIGHIRYKPYDVYVAETQGNPSAAHQVSEMENAAFTPDEVFSGTDALNVLGNP
ncbi:hypothetical protein PoB_004697300 [Plakobranchus ocellatus]|uniref:Uncharacterized protein n=1 Tax=Plakobranchus ocellatus TaxID=259542 RepID=A0AAV4BLN3_9GAST|nr:hypothetical protein PoB_004697300 [Plakobranchus ocellatus]